MTALTRVLRFETAIPFSQAIIPPLTVHHLRIMEAWRTRICTPECFQLNWKLNVSVRSPFWVTKNVTQERYPIIRRIKHFTQLSQNKKKTPTQHTPPYAASPPLGSQPSALSPQLSALLSISISIALVSSYPSPASLRSS